MIKCECELPYFKFILTKLETDHILQDLTLFFTILEPKAI